jgi:peroxiredoxin
MGSRKSRTATVGKAAPDFSLPTVDGGQWKLSEHTGTGPIVLVFLRGYI